MGFFSAIGVIVCTLMLMGLVGWLFDSIPNWFPAWRAKRQAAKFERGQEYGRKLLAGDHDDDVRKRFNSPEMEVGELDRLRYINNLLDESYDFDNFDHFDKGVESIVRPLITEKLKDEENPHWY